jgi:hypothetical protein
MDDDPALLCTLVSQVLAGDTVDLAALQAAADAMLTEAHGGNEALRVAVRYMSGAAFAYGVLGDAEALADLKTAARGFEMAYQLYKLHY